MALCNSEFFQPLTEKSGQERIKSLVRPIYNCSPVMLQPPIGVYIWAFLASVNSPKTFRFRHRSSVRKPAAATSKPRTISGNFLKMNAYRIFPRYSHVRDQFGPLKASIPRFSRQSLYRLIYTKDLDYGWATYFSLPNDKF